MVFMGFVDALDKLRLNHVTIIFNVGDMRGRTTSKLTHLGLNFDSPNRVTGSDREN